MAKDGEGLEIARARIAEEAEQRTGVLDLGSLGLHLAPDRAFRATAPP